MIHETQPSEFESENEVIPADVQETPEETNRWLEKIISPALPWLTVEFLIFAVIILLTVVTRFYDLGARVMSHDESLHTYYSWTLSQGQGYEHNPMMHGPLQFHMLALVYFLLGSSDFTARIPAVLFSIASVFVLWNWRRYLGKAGVIVAAVMMVISPYMLYYGRYVRNESFVGLFGLLTLYAVLRYLESGMKKYLLFLAAATVLHFTVKETAFIYTAQLLIFLAAYFVIHIISEDWGEKQAELKGFIGSLIIGVIGIGGALAFGVISNKKGVLGADETVMPALPGQENILANVGANVSPLLIFVIVGLIGIVIAAYFLLKGFSLERVRQERSFDMLMLLGTLILPMLVPLPMALFGLNPMDTSTTGILYILAFLVPVALFSILLGYWWNWNTWWQAALVFYAIFTIFYTTLFTNGAGFFTGLIGSLGYWLEQQGVERGSQPWYFYLLIQIPIYEFLPFIASIFAAIIGYKRLRQARHKLDIVSVNLPNTYSLLAWWSFSSLVAFTLAGEKMPWLTYHIALPMILFGGWAIGNVIERINWTALKEKNVWLVTALLAIFTLGIVGMVIAWTGEIRPFSGKELMQLRSTSTFILALIGTLASAYALIRMLEGWSLKQLAYVNTLIVFGLLAVLTARAAFRAAYITYDSGREYLVYAHGYAGNKDVLRQVTDLSNKLTGGMDILVAYDDDVSWPMSWYMRDFKKARYYGNQPGRDLREAPAIIVGDNNFAKVEPIVGDAYYRFDYIRMVWPNQDYFGLNAERIRNALTNQQIVAGIFDIWLNRDFTRYGEATGQDVVTDENWQPSDRMRLYVRKDVASQIWSYGAAPAIAPQADPYEGNAIELSANLIVGEYGSEQGQFYSPRGIAVAPSGDIYVADSRNHRIQQFTAEGKPVRSWGSYSTLESSTAPIGTFNEPWGVAVGPDGSVYVTDTWNHRVQKFSATGEPITMWGVFGLTDTPGALYGPRGISVDAQGRIYVADTGNKRIVIYGPNGNVLGGFGSEGYESGQFYEPVDVKVDQNGYAYVTDTWNQRIQVFAPTDDGLTFVPVNEWKVAGWFSETLENKPYLTIAPNGNVFITDPEGYRVIEFTSQGEFVRTWGDYGEESFAFVLPSAIAADKDGNIWVTDAGANRLMRFTMP